MKNRLENLKNKLAFEWGELASHLGISRSMLDQVRKGTRTAGPKLIRRLAAAESAAGITPPTPTPPAVFQTLEKRGSDFPNLGKKDADFSKPWKNAPDFFQTLEKRLEALEGKLDEVVRLLRERK